jgi:ubiquinone/menaquinone biosynthesis C-methylase UbiE
MGFFTLELARLVGPTGRVAAVDIQPKMLERLKHRAAKAGLRSQIEARLGSAEGLAIPDLRGKVDFTLAFAMVHETLDVEGFFAEVADASKPGASILFAEPSGHVKEPKFESELRAASDAGFRLVNRPAISRSHAALLQKN